MKFGRLLVLSILLFGSMLLVGAAKTDDLEKIIPQGEIIEENLYYSGNYFENNGTIDGSLFVSADDVLLNGVVDGNIFIMSQNEIVINGHIKGDIFIASSEKVIMSGRVDGSVFAFGKEVNLESRGEVNRDVFIVGDNINIYGAINRDANIYYASNLLVKGKILGNLNYTARTTNIIGGSVMGETKVRQVGTKDADRFMEQNSGRLFSTISFIFTTLIIWFLLSFVFKETKKKTASLLINKRSKLFFLYGLLGLLGTIGISIVLLLTYIGIPFALIILLLTGSAIYLSTGVFIIALSDYFGSRYPKTAGGNNILYVVGLAVIYKIIQLIPYFGHLISLIIVILGFGLILGSFYHKEEIENEHNLIL